MSWNVGTYSLRLYRSILLLPLVPSSLLFLRSCPRAGLWLPRVTSCSLLPRIYLHPTFRNWDWMFVSYFPTSTHMYLVCLSHYWENWLSWYLVEYLSVQKHSWLLRDSICFIRVACALQNGKNGTEFTCKGRLSGQVPGQWEGSWRTKAGTCWYPFNSHSMLRPCMRRRSKICQNHSSVWQRGKKLVTQQQVNDKTCFFGNFYLCFISWIHSFGVFSFGLEEC